MTDLTTVPSIPRRLSPLTRPATGTARLLTTQVTMEVRRYHRIPEYFIGVARSRRSQPLLRSVASSPPKEKSASLTTP